jgi:hypothetical protein
MAISSYEFYMENQLDCDADLIAMHLLEETLEVDEDFIYDSFSEKVGDLLIDTFESSINMIDEPADFKEKLEDAVKNL